MRSVTYSVCMWSEEGYVRHDVGSEAAAVLLLNKIVAQEGNVEKVSRAQIRVFSDDQESFSIASEYAIFADYRVVKVE